MTYPGMTTEGWGWEEEEDTVFLREGERGWISSLLCLSPRVLFQRTDPDSVVGVSPAVMIRSSSQDSEVSTVVGEHHAGALVGGVWIPFGRGFPLSCGGWPCSQVSWVLLVETCTCRRSLSVGSEPEISPRASPHLVKKVLPEAVLTHL